ncbi:MAG TPA: DEAD/DEAH box helicase, partial [Bacteroidales bacterium]|nr:DEAD/DEAH box helicase [Bacteroidales bacterium]
MLRLRAGYYIDEIYFGLWKYLSSDADLLREYFLSSSIQTGIKDENNYLHKIIDQLPNGNDDDEILREKTKQLYDNFFSGLTYFEIDGLSTSGTKDEIDPIVGVCYNLLSRGYPTRAPLKVVEYFLNKNFKEYYLGPEPRDNYGIKYVLYDSLWDSIKVKDVLNIILKQIPSDSEYLAENCGLGLFQIFESLKDLTSIAYIQKSILAALITQTISLDKSIISLYINEISKEISDLAISDLNDLLFHLFRLREADEIAPKLELRDELKHTDLALNFTREKISHPLSLEIKSTYVNQNAHTSFFTTSKIRYKELGTQNTQDENQEFKFHYKESEESLIYFLQNLLRKKEFWPGQLAIINRALQGKDIIGLLPTGGGKSLTYQLCGLLQPGITIIIDPINSLMHDQYEKLCDNGITNSAYMNSLNSYKYEDYRSRVSNGEFLFFLISPERFYMNKFRETLQSTRENNYYFSYGVVDEAHCVSEWGHDFRHVYLGLADNMRRFCSTHENSDLTIFGLTATASFDVLADVQRELVLSEDSIITLPPKAIDRINLKFEINEVIIQDSDPKIQEYINNAINITEEIIGPNEIDNDKVEERKKDLPSYWAIENIIGRFKYPRIKKFAEQLP